MPEDTWIVVVDGSQLGGEHNAEQVRNIMAKNAGHQLLVWNRTMTTWADPRTLPAFQIVTVPTPPPFASPPPPVFAPAPQYVAPAAGSASQVAVSQARDAFQEDARFFKGLLDFKFEMFITPKIVRVLYIITTVLCALGFIVMVFSGLMQLVAGVRTEYARGTLIISGLAMLIFAPIVSVLQLTLARIFFEVALVFFQIKDNTHKLAHKD